MTEKEKSGLAIVIPVIDNHEITRKCIESVSGNAVLDNDLLIIDNGSKIPIEPADTHRVIRNDKNIGVIESLEQGVRETDSDIIVYMHNDVLIHDKEWDKIIRQAFDHIKSLGVAGFFGAYTVHPNGGRGDCYSKMLGKEWGTSWENHSHYGEGIYPASVLDGLCMIFRREAIEEVDVSDWPPHHWYDRILPLEIINNGWSCATICIGFDHAGGMTASGVGYNQFAKEWCRSRGLTHTEGSYDLTIYKIGERMFNEKWAPRLPLTVNLFWEYRWNG